MITKRDSEYEQPDKDSPESSNAFPALKKALLFKIRETGEKPYRRLHSHCGLPFTPSEL